MYSPFFTLPPKCDHVGRLLKVRGNNVLEKVTKNFVTVLGYFEKRHFYVETIVDSF